MTLELILVSYQKKKKIDSSILISPNIHSTSISVYRVWMINVGIQISMMKLHTYIHLN